MSTPTSAPPSDIVAFAASVRAQLDDLPPDEVDELVDGLESDLAEQAADSGADFHVPDAAAYAAELRAAAGLPARADAADAREPLGVRARRSGAAVVAAIRASRAGAAVLDLFVALRPVWWLLRGFALYGMLLMLVSRVDHVVPSSLPDWGLLAVLMLVSVQWGRGRWAPWRWMRVGRTILSVLSVVAVPVLMAAAFGMVGSWRDTGGDAGISHQPGLVVDGTRVRNVFAYDSDGNPLTDVQLFDQSGKPLNTVGRDDTRQSYDPYFAYGGGPVPVPLKVAGRSPEWNVYPLQEIPADVDPETGAAKAAKAPFPRVPAVDRATAPPAPTDAATPGGAVTPGEAATPGAAATPSATPGPTP